MMPMTANKQLYLGLTCIGLEEKLCGGLIVPFRGDPLGKQDSYLLGEGPWKPNEVEKWKVARERWGAGGGGSSLQDTFQLLFPTSGPFSTSKPSLRRRCMFRVQMHLATALPPKVGGNQTGLCHPGLCHPKQLCPKTGLSTQAPTPTLSLLLHTVTL